MPSDSYRVSVLVPTDLECPDYLAVEALRTACELRGLKPEADTFQSASKPDGTVYYVRAHT